MPCQSYLLTSSRSVGRWVSNYKGATPSEDYDRSVRRALVSYRCEVLACVTEGEQVFAKMRFSGIHKADFRGYSPTDMPVSWLGAALFRFGDRCIVELWVLVDVAGLDATLKTNRDAQSDRRATSE